jgi:hypothetical protein
MAHLLTTVAHMSMSKCLVVCSFVLLCAEVAHAQQGSCLVVVADSLARAGDVQLNARVRAGELRFARQPRASLDIASCDRTDTLRVVRRDNLPRPVQPGVSYRDVEVEIEIRARLQVLCSPALRQLIARQQAASSLNWNQLCSATTDTSRIRNLP